MLPYIFIMTFFTEQTVYQIPISECYSILHCLEEKWDYRECVHGNVSFALHTKKCILNTAQCTLLTEKCTSHLMRCILHTTHCTLHWSQIVFMETLALLTIARYSQKLDRRDIDQMTLGENCKYSFYELLNSLYMNHEFCMGEKFGQSETMAAVSTLGRHLS